VLTLSRTTGGVWGPDTGLQLYDLRADRHVADLDVAPKNLVSGEGGSDEPMVRRCSLIPVSASTE